MSSSTSAMDATVTPLLTQSEEIVNQDPAQKPAWRMILDEVTQELKQLYAIAFPVIITCLLVYGKSVISMLFLGRLGKSALAGGSLSMGIANITGYSVISGLSMGMDPIAAQAHGAHRQILMTQTLHRTIAILLTITVPITILWLKVEAILVWAGQDPKIACIAASYLEVLIPSLVFNAFINPLKIYLRSKNVNSPLFVAATLALAFHIAINHLVCCVGLGVRGVAGTVAMTDCMVLLSLLFYLRSSDDVSLRSFDFFECFKRWRPILSLSVPSCLSVCLEWWWYELMIVLSGLLPNATESISTMGILMQPTALIYIFPHALSLAVSTRVGNELGANRPGRAQVSSRVAFVCAVLTSFIAMAFTFASRNVWGRVFTTDAMVISLTASVMPVVGLCELGNCPQTTSCGVLRGSARPNLGAFINLGSFYCIGLPLAGLMGFGYGMGLVGLWLGLMVAQMACLLLMVVCLWRTNWEKEAKKAQMLIRGDEKSGNANNLCA